MGTLRERIIARDDSKKEVVEVEEWGEKVEVRSLSGTQRAKLIRQARKEGNDADAVNLHAILFTDTLFDPETGEKIFQPEDMDVILEKSAAVLDRLGQIAFRLSGLGTGAVEKAEKN